MSGCIRIGAEAAKIEPQNEERQIDYAIDEKEGIVKKDRHCTDQFFIILFGVFLFVLIALLAYCMSYGNIYRIYNGYDNCGNICGRINTFAELDGTGCRGTDLRKQNFLRVQSFGIDEQNDDRIRVNRICVENCSNFSGYRQLLNRCLPEKSEQQVNSYFSKTGFNDFFQEAGEDLHNCWAEILYMCIVAFVFSVMTLAMFKHLAKVIVWVVLVGLIVVCIAITTFLWIYYKVEQSYNHADAIGKRRVKMLLIFACVSTVITVIVCLVIVFLRKRIELVIALFKEAGKAASDLPFLLFEPILTFIALSVVIALWLYFAIWIESSGHLTISSNSSARYVKDDAMKVTRWVNLMALFWASQFCIGCQHMVIAGAVAIWFFTRNKQQMDSPILTSFHNLSRYHLGTVALGSLLIASLQLIRCLLRFIDYSTKSASNRVTECCTTACQCCVAGFQNWLQFISRNAYIETAIYGDPFFVAGRKAFHQLMANSLRVFAINSLGDFVLFMGKAFIVLITVLTGMEMLRQKEGTIHHMWVPLTMAGIFAYLIAHCFITVYEMIIDTIFLCFCEDFERNDGLTRPYYMSSSLMDFIQQSKKLLAINDINDNRIEVAAAKEESS